MPDLELSPSCRIHYTDENSDSANVVVLLHGLGANSNSWPFQIPVLHQAGFRTIAPDAPGFGKSTYAGGRASVAQFAGPIESLLEHLGLPRINLVGISMGGVLSLQIALDHPEWVKRLVLVNTFAHLNTTGLRLLPYYLMRFILVHTLGLPTQAKRVAKHIFPLPEQEVLRQGLIEQVIQSDPQAYRAAMRTLARFDVRSRLGEIHCPTLVISGDRDTTVPIETQRYLAQNIANAKHSLIPDAGHGVTVERPELFNPILVEFLCG
jgi:pimeloyl-ACP methyl ester carboxylesterase